jgi:hypothetical protein
MVEVVTLRSLAVQIIFSPFSWLGIPVRIPMNFSMWAENCQNSYLPWQVVTYFVFSCGEMWILILSDELQLHMVHNYIIIYVRNWWRILGKRNERILNILSIHLPDKEILFLHTFNLNSTCSARGNVSYLFFFYATNIPHSTVDYITICEHNLIKCCRGDDLLEGLLKGLRVRAAGLKNSS